MSDSIALINEKSLRLLSEEIFFYNLSRDISTLQKPLTLVTEIISSRIESTYKSPSHIQFLGMSALSQNSLSQVMQFDDVCLKFLHSESGAELFITFAVKLARTFLVRLLATSLIDDSHGMLFSATEKGILSFICARLLLDLKKSLGNNMPDLKLLGIYHHKDLSTNDTALKGHGALNLSLKFADEIYPAIVILPQKILKPKKPIIEPKNIVTRAGHLCRPFVINLKNISMSIEVFQALEFGDLLLFKSINQQFNGGSLQGAVCARWADIAVSGCLDVRNSHYGFLIGKDPFKQWEDSMVENVEISGCENSTLTAEKNHTMTDLAKTIRISLAIELSRLPMTLRELCQIKEGEIIDLQRKLEDPLEMVVEGKVIGYCQPVQIDERLGIRILSINGEKNDHQK